MAVQCSFPLTSMEHRVCDRERKRETHCRVLHREEHQGTHGDIHTTHPSIYIYIYIYNIYICINAWKHLSYTWKIFNNTLVSLIHHHRNKWTIFFPFCGSIFLLFTVYNLAPFDQKKILLNIFIQGHFYMYCMRI